ncbi:MAG: sodium-independent anion transporter, partial [Chloroflexota bacterium]|nr:sodium-independent anion transporter [Chloroflexota bacterium]
RSAERDGVKPETSPVLVLRIDQSLYFANTSYCEEEALKRIAEQEEVRYLLLNLKSVPDIDVSGFEMLGRLVTNLADAGVSVSLAEVKKPVLEKLEQIGFLESLGEENVFLTTDEAVRTLKAMAPSMGD